MGGVLGGMAGIAIYFWRKGLRIRPYWDAIALGTAPGWAIARLGCAAVHDHPGVRSQAWFAVAFPDGPRLDMGLIDFVVLAVLTTVLYLLARTRRPEGTLMGVLAIGYSVPRFFLDFLRATDLPYVDGRFLGLTPAQWITPVLLAAGIYLLVTAPRLVPVATDAPGPVASPDEPGGPVSGPGPERPERPDRRHAPSAR
jgi:phosphatidylglycerol:prolipoprotein diacylglycerol transferase